MEISTIWVLILIMLKVVLLIRWILRMKNMHEMLS